MDTELVVIKVRRATRAALLARGKKGESYDDIIQKMMKELVAWEEWEVEHSPLLPTSAGVVD
jgi:hypothetical protein